MTATSTGNFSRSGRTECLSPASRHQTLPDSGAIRPVPGRAAATGRGNSEGRKRTMKQIEKAVYEAPSVIELGAFTAETGYSGIRNNDEITWFFDEWL